MDGRDAGYVYVVLSGEEREALVANVAAGNVLRTTLWSMALVALLGPAGGPWRPSASSRGRCAS